MAERSVSLPLEVVIPTGETLGNDPQTIFGEVIKDWKSIAFGDQTPCTEQKTNRRRDSIRRASGASHRVRFEQHDVVMTSSRASESASQ